jgi:hypothetical protein
MLKVSSQILSNLNVGLGVGFLKWHLPPYVTIAWISIEESITQPKNKEKSDTFSEKVIFLYYFCSFSLKFVNIKQNVF